MIGFFFHQLPPWLLPWRRVAPDGMLRVPGGRVWLAPPSDQPGARGAWRRVRGFWLDRWPVTNAEFRAFAQATGAPLPRWIARPGFDDPQQPVVGVTLPQARAYARWAGKRLPTPREWVRAARGDDLRPQPWGDTQPHPGLAVVGLGPGGAPAPATEGSPAASPRARGAGPFGHLDLVGNVWEWCADGTLRGGFWGSTQTSVDARVTDRPDRESAGYGFRCAR